MPRRKKQPDIAEQLREALIDHYSGATEEEEVTTILPLRQIADACKVDAAVLKRFMDGERDIKLKTAAKIAEYLGLVLALRE